MLEFNHCHKLIQNDSWSLLALDICPSCHHKGMHLDHQKATEGTLTCQNCQSHFWMSVIRVKGSIRLD